MLDDLLAELRALVCVGECGFERGAGDAERLRGDADASAFEIRQRDAQAFAALAEQIVFGDGAVFRRNRAGVGGADAEFMFGLAAR